MTPLKIQFTTVSGKEREVRVEAGREHHLGKQEGEEAYVELIGTKRGGVGIPRNNWDGGPGEPVIIENGEERVLYFHPWRGVLDEEPGSDKGLRVKLIGS